MSLLQRFERSLQHLVDVLFALPLRRVPDYSRLSHCRIVSHRGEHDNIHIMENTLDAFEQVYLEGVWGIEFDVRWSQDLQPVVIHDANCRRVFKSPMQINEYLLADIQRQIPSIPSLQQVIQRYGGKMHLMIELKQEDFRDIELQRSRLSSLLSGLVPARDFHLLALEPELFKLFNIVPKFAMLPVAELNLRRLSQQAIENDYAGISGQYLLMTERLIKKHRNHSQKIGVGFVSSRSCLYRELGRNVDWIFSNHAIALSRVRRQLLEKHRL